MNDLTYKRIAVRALAAAADIMDSTDPDDRRNTENDLVATAFEIIDAANGGDTDAIDLIKQASPAWLA